MICGFCSEELTGNPTQCPACNQSPLLDERYRLENIVGRGAMGVTYRAFRLEDDRAVAIKELPFRRIDAVKTKALFEREARVLEQLDHPGIPSYLDDFVGGVGKNLSLYLVQDFVEGDTLKAEMNQRRWREDEVLLIAAEVADILSYLHELSPPVIHRDIKPGNLMRRPDGTLALIDFGAVRDALDDEHTGGSTVVGTYGYMAPEQYKGDATPASDLYALGAMTVALLARKTPDALTDVGGRIDWQRHLDVHPQTQALLTDLLVMDPARRAQRARDVAMRCRQAAQAIEAQRNAPAPRRPIKPSAPPTPNAPFVMNAAPENLWQAGSMPESSDPPARQAGGAKLVASSALLLLFMGGFMAYLNYANAPEPLQPPVPARARCGGDPCPPVAQGLKGLKFGMTRAEATAALPEIANADRSTKHLPANLADLSGSLLGGVGKVPGDVITVHTTLGNLPATCSLDFIDAGKLTRMACSLEKQKTHQAHIAAEQALLAALTKRYGSPSSQSAARIDITQRHERHWRWEDAQAELMLDSEFMDFGPMGVSSEILTPKSELKVTNQGQAHRRVMRAAREQRRKERAQRAAQKERQAQEAARKAREALESGNLSDDL